MFWKKRNKQDTSPKKQNYHDAQDQSKKDEMRRRLQFLEMELEVIRRSSGDRQ